MAITQSLSVCLVAACLIWGIHASGQVLGQAVSSTQAAATNTPQAPASAPPPSFTDLDNAVAAITAPAGCQNIPSPSDTFKGAGKLTTEKIQMARATVPSSWQQLNANSSGGEIYTKQTVWVGYINRLRYTASLGGTVTIIQAPPVPSLLSPSTTAQPSSQTPTKSSQQKSSNREYRGFVPTTSTPTPGDLIFKSLGRCVDAIQAETTKFQGALAAEEIILNGTRESIVNELNNLTPIVGSAAEGRAAADLTIFPKKQIPSFPLDQVIALRGLLTSVNSFYSQTSQWANSPDNPDKGSVAAFQAESATAASAGALLDRYLSTTGTSNSPATGNNAGSSNSTTASNSSPGTNNSGGTNAPTNNGSNTAGSAQTTCSSTPTPGASKEFADYEANRCFINMWLTQFRTVAGANDAYFVVSYKPVCGGFFGQGTSTQMQLTVVDNLNPKPTPTPITLDKVVCEPALTISNGIGMSFITDHTPAFVAGVEKDAAGNVVKDSSGNPVIVQTLGYSSTSRVRPAYTLQVNTAAWSPGSVELHWSVGAMLTAATGGATTDVIAGPALSFKRRAFFVSVVYDLGLRTDYQSGFSVGMAQGNLTSPPTEQTWKSGFGITFTFPFSSGTNTQNSSNNGNATIVPAQSKSPSHNSSSGTGSGGSPAS